MTIGTPARTAAVLFLIQIAEELEWWSKLPAEQAPWSGEAAKNCRYLVDYLQREAAQHMQRETA